jgi:hypothetical protein
MTLTTLATATMIATAACMTTACGHPVGAAATEGRTVTPATTCAPVKVALIADKSKSAPGMRTPPVSLDDLESVIDIVATCGGELAVGVIHDRITDPFVRLRLDARPQKPADSQAHNVLRQRRQQAAIERTHTADIQMWEDDAVSRIAAFGERVAPLIEHAADANWSPVWDSVARGDLFLSERESGQAADARRVLILVSDAVDDVRGASTQRRAPLQKLKSGATVLIVNGAGSAGSLAALKPESFESFDAAARYVEQLAETPRPHATVANNK